MTVYSEKSRIFDLFTQHSIEMSLYGSNYSCIYFKYPVPIYRSDANQPYIRYMTVYDTSICHQREQSFIITFGVGCMLKTLTDNSHWSAS